VDSEPGDPVVVAPKDQLPPALSRARVRDFSAPEDVS